MKNKTKKSDNKFAKELFATFAQLLIPYIAAAAVVVVTLVVKLTKNAAKLAVNIFRAKHAAKDLDEKYIQLLNEG